MRNNYKNYNNLNIIKSFYANKNEDLYSTILDMNPEYKNRQKCRICGKDIFYNNVVFAGAYSDYIHINGGTSHLSKKVINNKEYALCVCEKCMLEKFPELRNMNMSRIYNRPTKYSEYAFLVPHEDIVEKNKELCIRSKESFIRKYGIDDGTRRWNSYISKESITNTFEYKNKVYGMTIDEFNNYNKSRSCTKDNFIKRHGEQEGIHRWNAYRIRQGYTNSLAYFIEKYGEIDGKNKFESINKLKHTNGHSNISIELFDKLANNDVFRGHNIMYYGNGGEYEVYDPNSGVYYIDFVDFDMKICIEFNGNKFHPNPNEYSQQSLFKNPFQKEGELVSNILRKESIRKEFIENKIGLKMFVVWEDEYKKDKEKTICELIRNITNYYNEIHGN